MHKKLSLLAMLAAIALMVNIAGRSAQPAQANSLSKEESAALQAAAFQAVALQYTPQTQSAELFYDEGRTVYLGNLERRKAGQPPLRWNRELTLAARWFSWDSVENRPYGWIGHQDTQGKWPGDRTSRYGYLGGAGAENAAWASWLISPEGVIDMWMHSEGHRENLLSPGHAEIGVGYYSRGGDGSTYATQDFGNDGVYPPLIIENELLNTTDQNVTLYQYPGGKGGGMGDIGKPTQMMISNSPCFSGASWQAYQPELSWTLPPGQGWKTVYAKIIDQQGRTSTASDTIYLGETLPKDTLNLSQLSQTTSTVKLYNLDTAQPSLQLSLGWIEDDPSFGFLWGKGSQVADPAAIGKTTYKLDLDDMESSAWVTNWTFIPEQPMVAYFRLKTSDNSSPDNIARIQVEANGVRQERNLKGTDFSGANQYQEFAIPFTYHQSKDNYWLDFQFWRTGGAVIYVDAVTIFTASKPLTGSNYSWQVPGGHYRGQGVWVRYANGSAFTPMQPAETMPVLTTNTDRLDYMVAPGQQMHKKVSVSTCGSVDWSVVSAPGWLQYNPAGGTLDTWVSADGMRPNMYQGSLVISTNNPPATVTIPVQAVVAERVEGFYLPVVEK